VGRELSPADLRELLGAYALDALEPDERAQVDALLLTDQDARAELHALQLGAAWLARSDLRPSEQVWERIRAQMDVGADEVDPAHEELPAPTALASRRRSRVGRIVVAAAVAAAVVVGVVAVVIEDTNGPGGTSVEAAARAAIADPKARHVDLRTAEGRVAAKLAVYDDGRGYIVDATLPPLPGRSTYQLWAITKSGPVSEAVLGRSPTVAEIPGATGARAYRYAITTEPRGGSPSPTGAFAASSDLGSA